MFIVKSSESRVAALCMGAGFFLGLPGRRLVGCTAWTSTTVVIVVTGETSTSVFGVDV